MVNPRSLFFKPICTSCDGLARAVELDKQLESPKVTLLSFPYNELMMYKVRTQETNRLQRLQCHQAGLKTSHLAMFFENKNQIGPFLDDHLSLKRMKP